MGLAGQTNAVGNPTEVGRYFTALRAAHMLLIISKTHPHFKGKGPIYTPHACTKGKIMFCCCHCCQQKITRSQDLVT